ncbi:TRAM domain-containing protein [bacterium]|nr:TRAM domain-containing protein [bacterium]
MLLVLRIGVLAFLGGTAGYLMERLAPGTPYAYLIGAALGVGVGVIFVALELWLSRRSNRKVIAGAIGLLGGLLIALLVSNLIRLTDNELINSVLTLGYAIVFVYLGVVIATRKLPENWFLLADRSIEHGDEVRRKILDTSVIIDGRIADIAELGFLDGRLIVPKFVLAELQLIADSSDGMKRNRGRRGLDILNAMQKKLGERIVIENTDFPEIKGVDAKLVKLAMTGGGVVITNDYNLNKVAELQGVDVLNINELANALKPVYISGEKMRVKLVKEGSEPGQGVGYLDDGTMVVVDGGRQFIGSDADVIVTSTLQTAAGRMIFAKTADM